MLCTRHSHDGVSTLTLSSPDNRNALGLTITSELRNHLRDCATDPGVRVVVITAVGTTFSSGWDLKLRPDEGLAVDKLLVDVLEQIRTGPKPVVARVTGHAFGGALGLIAACDLSVAVRHARFAFGEARLGLAPTTAAVHCVPKLRPADALELILTGAPFSADRAAEVGLINRAVDAEVLDDAVSHYLESLLLGGPLALAACKHLARSVTEINDAAYALADNYSRSLVGSPEALEGVAAFVERRAPHWVIPD
jgi:methylglutaconyl-CoA hydratase